MDPISLIVGALAVGAAKGVGDTAATAVGDLYRRLKDLVRARLGDHPDGERALVAYEGDPKASEAALVSALEASGAAEDLTLLRLAQRFLAEADPEGTEAGRYVIVTNSQGVQLGDHNTQHNTYG